MKTERKSEFDKFLYTKIKGLVGIDAREDLIKDDPEEPVFNLLEMRLAFNAGRRAERRKACQWALNDPSQNDFWETECGGTQYFSVGDVNTNAYEFCPYCGGKIVEPKKTRKGKR